MRLPILTTFFAVIVFSCSSNPKVRQPKFPNDPKLVNTWQSFRRAVNKFDTAVLVSLSHSCIYCGLCFSSPDTSEIISVTEFYRHHFRAIFDDQLVQLMNDSAKVWAAYDNNSTFPERDSCLAINGAGDNRLADVYITIGTHDRENSSVLVQFVKIDSSFKFYGVSMMP